MWRVTTSPLDLGRKSRLCTPLGVFTSIPRKAKIVMDGKKNKMNLETVVRLL